MIRIEQEKPGKNSSPDYDLLAKQVRALGEEETYWLPVLANTSALLMAALPDLNWAGFYLMNRDSLVLGPFQGNPACIRIPLCAGVCGAAARQNKIQRIDDVHQFPGHIACDSASNSEIVLPLHKNGRLVGVLDLDSPLKGRFTPEDETGLQKVVSALEEVAEFTE